MAGKRHAIGGVRADQDDAASLGHGAGGLDRRDIRGAYVDVDQAVDCHRIELQRIAGDMQAGADDHDGERAAGGDERGQRGPAPGTPLEAALARERDRTGAGILACVYRAVARGELDASSDVTGLAALIHGFLAGIALRARDGESLAAIDRGIDALLRTWDAHRPP